MNTEVLKPENKRYLEQYRSFGFKSKFDLIDDALEMHRQKRKQIKNRDELLRAGLDYAKDNSYAWAELDEDDFEG